MTLAQGIQSVKRNSQTKYTPQQIEEIVENVIDVSRIFNFRTSLFFAQILHETGRFRYGGQVLPHQFNFAGLGATNDGAKGATFPDIRTGVIAVACHRALYQYGDIPDWPGDLGKYAQWAIRRDAVRSAGYLGVCRVVGDFTNGRWAWSPQYPRHTLQNGYAEAMVRVANEILSYPRGEEMTAQIPGFEWAPADRDHYQSGRTDKIRGGAQHYTAGTSSLNWLRSTSNPQVSVHFLVKNKPTMDDRGWQLVRIEDTAWTTAFANSYTVAIEYEHTGSGHISDEAYDVLAQTWLDIAQYVKEHNLGAIEVSRKGIRGHKEWVGNPSLTCPDGINVDRIVQRAISLAKPSDPPAPAPDSDPNAQLFENGKWIVNVNYEGIGMVKMLDFYREQGGLPMLGLPMEGMSMEIVDGKRVFKQRTENVLLEFWPDGFGNMGAMYRFGRTVS